MELRLEPEIPVTRVVNGHNIFNKGYHHGLKGKSYEEYYGKERAVEIKKRHSEALKGHKCWSDGTAHAFPCIAVTPRRGMVQIRLNNSSSPKTAPKLRHCPQIYKTKIQAEKRMAMVFGER